ncbi:putative quinol monooxygenase [Klebsiella pneumoniae]
MGMQVDLLVTLQPRMDRVSELHESLLQLREASLAEPGCLYYRLARAQPPSQVFYLLERWADVQALETHEGTLHFVEGVEQVQACCLSVEIQKLVWLE